MRKGRPLTPAEEKAQAEYEAWHEARMQDLADEEQERREALRKGMLISNTENEFRYEWIRTRRGTEEDCVLSATFYDDGLMMSAITEHEGCAYVDGEPARLLTAWLIERGYGPKGGAT
ncbi:hypothetical protein DK867_20095 [Ochrobactrum sp. POC9]|uniref:hypothetical protein n=1 Tax=unclassified Ochrobactrum TaxID=239106 RepID=UPI000D707631|nr:hypothetical protein [Ochrobactrum sp. POC9]MCH4542750.1 hypothetical protein [Ochrobactrum sp. A-1]PWU71298.1 hypothetical protein DK867_20095 [Ochrobactrum sp. POC9]